MQTCNNPQTCSRIILTEEEVFWKVKWLSIASGLPIKLLESKPFSNSKYIMLRALCLTGTFLLSLSSASSFFHKDAISFSPPFLILDHGGQGVRNGRRKPKQALSHTSPGSAYLSLPTSSNIVTPRRKKSLSPSLRKSKNFRKPGGSGRHRQKYTRYRVCSSKRLLES